MTFLRRLVGIDRDQAAAMRLVWPHWLIVIARVALTGAFAIILYDLLFYGLLSYNWTMIAVEVGILLIVTPQMIFWWRV